MQRIVRVLELAAEAMDDLAYTTGPRTDALVAHCREFMQCIKVLFPSFEFFFLFFLHFLRMFTSINVSPLSVTNSCSGWILIPVVHTHFLFI